MEGGPEPALEAAVRGSVHTDPESLVPFGHDRSHLAGVPRAVVAPADQDDVVALVRWARRAHVPLVARGAGTSLDGESVPLDGAVVVDLSGWNAVLEVDAGELWARVGPGTVNQDLQNALRPQGIFFPPNPGSWTVATIGGHVGTNASGPRSFRYGPTRAWVRAVDAVLGTGERAKFGSRVAKRSVGPDLLHLIVGSEGTLAIVTEVTVRLAPLPGQREGLVFPLEPRTSLGDIARRLLQAPGTGLSAVEYLDRGSAAVLAERRHAEWPSGSGLLLLEVEADDAHEAQARRERIARALRPAGLYRAPTVFSDADELWTLRGASGTALDERMGLRIREDVAVPLGRVDELVRTFEEIARDQKVGVYLYGHLGEGSFHPNFVVDPSSPAGDRVRAAVLHAALALGGTVSSEHGIGRTKTGYLERELGHVAVELLEGLKRRCDPDGILNPGKLYPPRPPRAGGRPSPWLSGPVGAAIAPGRPIDGSARFGDPAGAAGPERRAARR